MDQPGDRATSVTAGAQAEGLACSYLQQRGLTLLERNYRCRQGEIDLIMQDREFLVFVEVRYRRRRSFGSAAESISGRKRARIVHTARYYLQRRPAPPPCRFDVLALEGDDLQHIEWIRDAFQ